MTGTIPARSRNATLCLVADALGNHCGHLPEVSPIVDDPVTGEQCRDCLALAIEIVHALEAGGATCGGGGRASAGNGVPTDPGVADQRRPTPGSPTQTAPGDATSGPSNGPAAVPPPRGPATPRRSSPEASA